GREGVAGGGDEQRRGRRRRASGRGGDVHVEGAELRPVDGGAVVVADGVGDQGDGITSVVGGEELLVLVLLHRINRGDGAVGVIGGADESGVSVEAARAGDFEVVIAERIVVDAVLADVGDAEARAGRGGGGHIGGGGECGGGGVQATGGQG